ILFILIQAGLIWITNYYYLITYNEAKPFTMKGYTISFVSFIIILSIVFVIRFTKEGYSFDPSESGKGKKITNKVLLFVNAVSVFLVCGLLYEYKTNQILYYFEILFIFLSIVT